MLKKFIIYQLKDECMVDFGFRGYDFLKEHNLKVNKDNYWISYSDAEVGVKCSDDEYLERIYERFNIERPDDFKGHSLSIGDVIVLNNTAYYTDTFGFRRLESF